MARIIAVNTLLPEHSYIAEEALSKYFGWISGQKESFKRKAEKIFLNTPIEEKHTIAPVEVLFKQRTIEEVNNLYKENAVRLGTEVLSQTLNKSGIKPDELDLIITTSCTGFMIPSFDAYVINNLGLRKDIKRMPITELGCAAGVSALVYANDFLNAYPDKKVAVITLEFPSNTIQLNDFSWDNIIGTAIFADGVGCAILGGDNPEYPDIIDSQMIHMSHTTEILGYDLTNTGLKMTLSKDVPEVIEQNFEQTVSAFLGRNNLTINDIDHWLAHPGGVKILDKIESILSEYGKNVDISRKIMSKYGNMSSSTILFILNECMKFENKGKTALLLSFGPGFAAHQLILRWS